MGAAAVKVCKQDTTWQQCTARNGNITYLLLLTTTDVVHVALQSMVMYP